MSDSDPKISDSDPKSYFLPLVQAWLSDDPGRHQNKDFLEELERLRVSAFSGILKRAGEGEVAAVDWLLKRRFIKLPIGWRDEASRRDDENS